MNSEKNGIFVDTSKGTIVAFLRLKMYLADEVELNMACGSKWHARNAGCIACRNCVINRPVRS